MKKDTPSIDNFALEPISETPLMVFREILRVSFAELFVGEDKDTNKVPREVLGLVGTATDLDLVKMMSQRETEELRDVILSNSVWHRHLQELTVMAMFQLASVGTREQPYTIMEVASNFCTLFYPGGKDVKDSAMLNADNMLATSYYRDENSMIKLLIANPWLLVLWMIRFDSFFFNDFESFE